VTSANAPKARSSTAEGGARGAFGAEDREAIFKLCFAIARSAI
jgi:hypothetical protein